MSNAFVLLGADIEISSVTELTTFYYFFFSGWKHSPSLRCKLWIISVCTGMCHGGYLSAISYTCILLVGTGMYHGGYLSAISFFPYSLLVGTGRSVSAALSGLAGEDECKLISFSSSL